MIYLLIEAMEKNNSFTDLKITLVKQGLNIGNESESLPSWRES